jgi:2-(1,2-epoxy-1,2-dihydrophenyl)acetyl-CoA isomerase
MPDILTTIDDGVAIITLNRPERLNAFSDELLYGTRDALVRYDDDPAVRCIVITGAGRGFCAGGDVKALGGRVNMDFEDRVADLGRKQRLTEVIKGLSTPTIAMINGVAVGAGLAIAMACDLRYTSRSARFGTGFRGVGFSGDFGTSYLLTEVVGTARARELYFTGRMFDSNEAKAIGLVHDVFDDAILNASTLGIAKGIE